MRDDQQLEEVRPGAARFDAVPVRAASRVPRAVLVVAVTAVIAFVAGIATAAPERTVPVPSGTQTPVTAPAVADDAAATQAARPSTIATREPDPAATPSPAAGSSAFLAGFKPGGLLPPTPDGRACRVGDPRDKVVPRTRRDGPRLTFQRTWIAWCPLAEADRQSYLVDLFAALSRTVPAETYGFSAGLDGGGDALLPYAEPPLAGTLAVAADAAGRGLAIAIVAEEWAVATR